MKNCKQEGGVMMKKFVSLVVVSCMVLLTGCGSSSDISTLEKMDALNSESDTTENYKLSYTDEQSMIYSQVVDRTLLDLSTLSACADNELQQVVAYMDSVDAILVGTAEGSEDVIESCFTDYLLAEFEKTPYYWQRTQTKVRGIDAESRSIIVDVTYKTIDFEKTVQEASTLILGEASYETKLQVRYDRWLNILDQRYNNYSDVNWQADYDEFVKVYGDIETILKSQSNYELTNQMFETGNQKTYAGLIDNEAETGGGTMVVRYVLVPRYTLGINLGITCEHMYVLDYKLDNDITNNKSMFTEEGYATVADSVYDLIYSYFQCVDENDYSGLYSLSTDFGKLDRYFEDKFATTYTKHDGYTVSLFNIQGTHIECGLTISSKQRAKGSKMTFPSYTDRYYVEIELVDDKLKIQNMTLLSRVIEGEPDIKTEEAEDTGFASTIDLDNDDKLALEDLICKMGTKQLAGIDTSSSEFGEIFDISVSNTDLAELEKSVLSLSGSRKVTWIMNYQQGTSNYASIKCKELYQASDNSIIESVVVYDFISKGGKWYIYRYNILSQVRLDTTNLNTTGCLCLVSPNKVESYTSQIKGSASSSVVASSDITATYDHREYTPVLKSGTQEQGLTIASANSISDEEYEYALGEMLNTVATNLSREDIDNYGLLISELDEKDDAVQLKSLDSMLREIVTVYYNYTNNRYVGKELSDDVSALETSFSEASSAWTSAITDEDGEHFADVTTCVSILRAIINNLPKETN